MVRPHPGLWHLHAPSQLESGRAAFKDQDENRALCPIPRNHFLTGSVQVYSCFQWEDKPELEVETHRGLAVQRRISSCPGLEETQTEGATRFYPWPPNPGQCWQAVPHSCHRHLPPVHPEFPSGSILCVPSAQWMPGGQQAAVSVFPLS